MFVVVEAPDFVAGFALRERLAQGSARLVSGEVGETQVVVDRQVALPPLLASVHDWMEEWKLDAVTLRLRTTTYVLRRSAPVVGWISDDRALSELELVDASSGVNDAPVASL